jgi:membrane protein DedA with SNARE-associated domain
MKLWVRNILVVILLIFPIAVVSLDYLEDLAETGAKGGAEGWVSLAADLPKRVIGLASQAGYVGIFALMLLEAAALPVPSELILPFAGYLVSRGDLEFWVVIFWSTVASLIGSFIDYYLGSRVGGAFYSGKFRLPYIDEARLRTVDAWFSRYGSVTVILLRLVPAARVLISFPAGVYRMSKSKFAVCTLAGCLPWNIVLVYLGWNLGSSWSAVVEAFRYVNIVAYALLILLLVWIVHRLTRKRRVKSREGYVPSEVKRDRSSQRNNLSASKPRFRDWIKRMAALLAALT